MILRSTLISTSLIALLAACGGGGAVQQAPQDTDGDGVADTADPFPSVTGTDLESFTDDTLLQSISLDATTNTSSVTEAAKSTTSEQWTTTDTDYVVQLDNGDIVGVAMESIPASVEFAATGTANMVIVQGSTQYGLLGGDVTGSLSSDATTLTVGLSWEGEEIDAQNEDQSAASISAMTMNLTSSLSGETDCGGANMLCGGTVSVTANEASLIDTTNLNANQYKAGIYGSTAANAELGGQINYVDPNTLSIVGSFVGDTK